MINPNDVTGLIVDPASVATGERREGAPKDSTTIVRSPETIAAETIARAAEVQAAELRTASQRQVNMIWEYTQAGIAALIVVANVAYIFALLWVNPSQPALTAAALLANAFFLIVGFYFGRTNHQNVGGVGTHLPFQQSGR